MASTEFTRVLWSPERDRAGQGFLAAVVVKRSRDGKADAREVYRDMEVSGGNRWLTSDEALQHALMQGANAVAAERQRAMAPTVRTVQRG